MKILYLITARGGSKGLPGKNIKMLGGKPLFMYSVEFVNKVLKKGDELCISTNDDELIALAKENNLEVPFRRPEELASDTATSDDVIRHAINYYKDACKEFDAVMLLQPTSPFRTVDDFNTLLKVFEGDCEMAVSVKQSKENPYFTLFEEDKNEFLNKSKKGAFTRRQDCPVVYAYNGSMYLIKIKSFKSSTMGNFTKIKKIVMPEKRSVDIDTMADWVMAEYYLGKQ
jgi:CMP-N,N'-diacetyllegionaminic acid synthase